MRCIQVPCLADRRGNFLKRHRHLEMNGPVRAGASEAMLGQRTCAAADATAFEPEAKDEVRADAAAAGFWQIREPMPCTTQADMLRGSKDTIHFPC